jgi:hypothetical protein
MGRTCSTHEEKRNTFRFWVENPEGKSSLGRPIVGGRVILKWILEIG